MSSRSPMDYLERKRIFAPRTRHLPRFNTLAQHSHRRPIIHDPVLIGPDNVADRVFTQEERKRVPYAPNCSQCKS